MLLDEIQRRALLDDGYLLVPGLVTRERVDAALKAINHSLGEEGIAKDQIWTLRAQTFCPELAAAPEILDLYRATPVVDLAEAALGAGNVVAPTTGQIALRFPQKLAEPQLPYPHIDGMPGPLNGVEAGTLYHFTALAAVFLSDTTAPFQGNFTVWPGSHRALEAYFRAHGTGELVRGFPPIEMARAAAAHRPRGRRAAGALPARPRRRAQRRPARPLRRLLPARPPRPRSDLDRHAHRPVARVGRGARSVRGVIGLRGK